jgi:hypothetical protein
MNPQRIICGYFSGHANSETKGVFLQEEKAVNTNIPDFSSHYAEIGQSLVDLLPTEFKSAWAKVDIISDNDVWSSEVFYLKDNGRYEYLFEDLQTLEQGFWELNKAYKKAGLAPWTTATFCLTSTCKMTLDLGYDDVSDFDIALKKRNEWIKNI